MSKRSKGKDRSLGVVDILNQSHDGKNIWSRSQPDQGLVLTLDATGYARIEVSADMDGGILFSGEIEIGWVNFKTNYADCTALARQEVQP